MALYCLNEEVGAGLPLWLPNGCRLRDKLEAFIKELERRADYQRVSSPHIGKQSLYERSGHLAHFAAEMYPPMLARNGANLESYYLRPMSCPHHHQI